MSVEELVLNEKSGGTEVLWMVSPHDRRLAGLEAKSHGRVRRNT